MPDVGTRALILEVDGTDYSAAVKKAVVRSSESDSDFMSFEDARNGGLRDYTLAMTVKQDTTASSLWDLIWSNSGDEVDVEVWPNGGGTTPSASQPKYSGTVVITDPDGDLLGGEANPSPTAKQVVEVEWKFTAKPTKATS